MCRSLGTVPAPGIPPDEGLELEPVHATRPPSTSTAFGLSCAQLLAVPTKIQHGWLAWNRSNCRSRSRPVHKSEAQRKAASLLESGLSFCYLTTARQNYLAARATLSCSLSPGAILYHPETCCSRISPLLCCAIAVPPETLSKGFISKVSLPTAHCCKHHHFIGNLSTTRF